MLVLDAMTRGRRTCLRSAVAETETETETEFGDGCGVVLNGKRMSVCSTGSKVVESETSSKRASERASEGVRQKWEWSWWWWLVWKKGVCFFFLYVFFFLFRFFGRVLCLVWSVCR